MPRGRPKAERVAGTCGDCPIAAVSDGVCRCVLRRNVAVLPHYECLVSAAELRVVARKLEAMADGR
jgi:hypothetical protein